MRLAEGLVKWLTGGDPVTARRLYEATFEFTPRFKLLLAANGRPRVREARRPDVPPPAEGAVHRRPAGRRARRGRQEHPHRSGRVCNAAILAWAVEGLRAWRAGSTRRRPSAPPPPRTGEREPLVEFLAATCRLGPERWVRAKLLRDEYEAWARENGVRHPLGGKAFGAALRRTGCAPANPEQHPRMAGLDLRDPDEPDFIHAPADPAVDEPGA